MWHVFLVGTVAKKDKNIFVYYMENTLFMYYSLIKYNNVYLSLVLMFLFGK